MFKHPIQNSMTIFFHRKNVIPKNSHRVYRNQLKWLNSLINKTLAYSLSLLYGFHQLTFQTLLFWVCGCSLVLSVSEFGDTTMAASNTSIYTGQKLCNLTEEFFVDFKVTLNDMKNPSQLFVMEFYKQVLVEFDIDVDTVLQPKMYVRQPTYYILRQTQTLYQSEIWYRQ